MSIYTARYNRAVQEKQLLSEALRGIHSSDDRGRSIWNDVLRIEQNKQCLQNHDLTSKQIAKYNESTSNCMLSISENMRKLGADDVSVNQMMNLINKNDKDGAYIHLLKLLVQRNPGLYARKLTEYQSAVKQK